jgi:CBS domain-containing protein
VKVLAAPVRTRLIQIKEH